MIRKNPTNKSNDNQTFTPDELKIIRLSFSFRYKIEEALNKYQPKQNNHHNQNIMLLLDTLDKGIELQLNLKKRFTDSFGEFLKIQENIPIEVNLKKVRYEQLTYLLDEWENSMSKSSLLRNPQRLYSIEHRNILFSRVFFQQKQNIDEYFSTLSEKKMLKGVDLYQLLGDILSPYYLYEFSSDNQTFFEKVNSFNNFLEIVDQFINSENRIILDNKSKDFQFIKLYEFEALIYFWQSINKELQLKSDKRFSIASKQVQTERHEIAMYRDAEAQTLNFNEKVSDLQTVINTTLKQLNTLTEAQNQPEILEIIQNLCQSLRLQKICLNQFLKSKQTSMIQYTEKSPHKRTPSNQHERLSSNFSEFSQLQQQKTQRISMKVSQSPQEKRGSLSKRKSQRTYQNENLRIILDRTDSGSVEEQAVNRHRSPSKSKRIQKSSQKRRNVQENQESQTSIKRSNDYIIKNLQLSDMRSQTNYIDDNLELRRIDTATQNQTTIFSLFELIYKHYSDPTINSMNIERLNRFFVDIGIIQEKQFIYELKCLRKAQIKNPAKIKQVQFLQIMGLIMKDDQDLTFDVISEFVDLYVNDFTIDNVNQINVKINIKPEPINPTKFSQNRSHQLKKYEEKTSIPPSYVLSAKKQGYSPSYNQNFIYSRGSNLPQNSPKRKRYAYCQETPKFQQDMPFNRFTQNRKTQFSRQKKISLPVPGYRKYPLQKY